MGCAIELSEGKEQRRVGGHLRRRSRFGPARHIQPGSMVHPLQVNKMSVARAVLAIRFLRGPTRSSSDPGWSRMPTWLRDLSERGREQRRVWTRRTQRCSSHRARTAGERAKPTANPTRCPVRKTSVGIPAPLPASRQPGRRGPMVDNSSSHFRGVFGLFLRPALACRETTGVFLKFFAPLGRPDGTHRWQHGSVFVGSPAAR